MRVTEKRRLMKALVLDKPGSFDYLHMADSPVPEPGPGDVRDSIWTERKCRWLSAFSVAVRSDRIYYGVYLVRFCSGLQD